MGLKTALVVDDSRLARLALSRTLERHGWHVEQAASAAEGLVSLRSHKPGVVFMDVTMPEMDGFAAIAHIRRDPANRDIPVVMCSAEETEQVRRRAEACGAFAFLSKSASDEGIERLLDDLDRTVAPTAIPAVEPREGRVAAAGGGGVPARPAIAPLPVPTAVPAHAGGPTRSEVEALIEAVIERALAEHRAGLEAEVADTVLARLSNGGPESWENRIGRVWGERIERTALAAAREAATTHAAEVATREMGARQGEWLGTLMRSVDSGPLANRIAELAASAAAGAARQQVSSMLVEVRESVLAVAQNELAALRRERETLPSAKAFEEMRIEARTARQRAEEALARSRSALVVLAFGLVVSIAVNLLL